MNIQADMINALKAGDTLRVSVLRMLLSEMNYKKINVQRELTDADLVEVVAREVKKRREAIDSFTKGGRMEQAATEKQELEILVKYLPEMLSEQQIREQISNIKEIQGVTDFGQVMKVVAPSFKGKADGALVAKIVREMIA
jgi:hypothetical protein